MSADTAQIHGKTLRFKFNDGPMAGKTFEHAFDDHGTVTWKMLGGEGKPSKPTKYELAHVNFDVFAVSYLGDAGYTLTTILDFNTGLLVAFASNEKSLVKQHGTFEVVKRAAA
ncbi:MAG: hypothetical protein JWO36_4019 [Myxococcales bacterium]|nr:hypothetical protein [Myxococcales bacterium]